MQIKGKGMLVTYWLLGEDKEAKHVEVIEDNPFSRGYGRSTRRFKTKSFASARGEFRHMSRKEKVRRRQTTLPEQDKMLP